MASITVTDIGNTDHALAGDTRRSTADSGDGRDCAARGGLVQVGVEPGGNRGSHRASVFVFKSTRP